MLARRHVEVDAAQHVVAAVALAHVFDASIARSFRFYIVEVFYDVETYALGICGATPRF